MFRRLDLCGDLRINEVLDDDTAILFKCFDADLKGTGAVESLDPVGAFWCDTGWFVGELGVHATRTLFRHA